MMGRVWVTCLAILAGVLSRLAVVRTEEGIE